MAKRYQVPSLKVRQRSTKGKSKFKKLSRGRIRLKPNVACNSTVMDDVMKEQFMESRDSDDNLDFDCDYDKEWEPVELPSLYSVKKRMNANAWESEREKLRDACVQTASLPDGQLCISCSNKADIWCRRCSPFAYFCEECWLQCHDKTNIFHIPEIWAKDHFKPVVMLNRRIDALKSHHTCDTRKDVIICCLDEDGVEHKIQFATCGCESITVTLVRARLWPATPQFPRYAFSFDLLDWYEALLVECQVSLKDLCEALYYKCPYLVIKRRDVYESLIDSFEEYRFMKSQLRHLQFLCSELDNGEICPACPKEIGTVIVSMDALFGLPRKKAAGSSHKAPLNQGMYFLSQQVVDDFVNKQVTFPNQFQNNECNSFLAGNPLRSLIRYHALDETAVFGCACRHEIPLMFLNLKHGERLGYAIFMLRKVMSYYADTVNVIMMYDIACTLDRHLKVNNDALNSTARCRLKLAIPSFHAYGHKAECQLTLSPLRCSGAGLSDGEVMERMWSFLRRFSRMTKEMRPSHRLDILSSALNYYAYKKKQSLHFSLFKRFQKAQGIKTTAEECLKKLILQYKLTDNNVLDLVDEPSNHTCSSNTPTPEYSWEHSYFLELLLYYQSIEQISIVTKSSLKKKLERTITRVQVRLKSIEDDHSVSERWNKNGELYQEYFKFHQSNRQRDMRKQLKSNIQKRHFLLRQKAKYGDGQKIANKLSKQITKLTSTIRDLLSNYNDLCIYTNEATLDIHAVLNPDSTVWSVQSTDNNFIRIPSDAKHEIVQYFLEVKRSEEELNLLKDEISNIINYYDNKIEITDSAISEIQSKSPTSFNRGSIALLMKLRWSFEILSDKAKDMKARSYSCNNDNVDWSPQTSESEDSDYENNETYD